MNKKYKDDQGKAIKWKDTRSGRKRYAALRLLQKAIMFGVSRSAISQIELIQRSPAKTPEMKLKKALAIADAVINGRESVTKAFGVTTKWLA